MSSFINTVPSSNFYHISWQPYIINFYQNFFQFSLFSEHQNVPICGASKIQCYHDAEDELLNKNFLDGLTMDTSDCKCLPACQTIDYDLEITHANLDWVSLFQAHNSPEEDYVGLVYNFSIFVYFFSLFVQI